MDQESQGRDNQEQVEPIGDPPPTLDDKAQLKWKQIAITFTWLTSKDRTILEQFCSAYVIRKMAEQKAKDMLDADIFKPTELNSISGLFKNANEVCLRTLQEMQGTPLSRAKKAPAGEQEENGNGKRKKLPDKYKKFFD